MWSGLKVVRPQSHLLAVRASIKWNIALCIIIGVKRVNLEKELGSRRTIV